MTIDILKIASNDLNSTKIDSLIASRQSFQIVAVSDISAVVTEIEGRIALADLTCRIFTEYRKAAIAGSFFGPTALLGAAAAIGIAAHNLATINPDYEIGKNKIAGTVTVTYKK
ncbi:hypothetical protein UNDYM_2300 [Undibacterium sp. YM2]|uniref:hypothetical protein n=1 Tax=Undibacterium sp. YM2 TaxID=2058625 RepID=UPI001331F087|nr:hypothetical protein [Undibacterium sp. YM2]BBB66553.1 hypothetical protein UNDYM_2300 [Undibacterium sp. YM2]